MGIILQPNMGNRPDLTATWWGADNGCYTQGTAFRLERFLAWLDSWTPEERARCLFAVAPDVLADAAATLERSVPVLPQLRARGYRAALVAQDGLDRLSVPWGDFDVLFVGGTTAWKLSEAAYGLAAEAKRRGKWIHLARVNSLRWLQAATIAGYDSADGTILAFGPYVNLIRVERWLVRIRHQPVLPLDRFEEQKGAS